jgi:hypothetical protein
MSSPSIEGANSASPSSSSIAFGRHGGFEKEAKKFASKHPGFDSAMGQLERLLAQQFHPTAPRTLITPKNLHCIRKEAECELWKMSCVATPGLRRAQMPRIYFYVRLKEIWFLCLGTHIENYDDDQLQRTAFTRMAELLG